jgi:hypothetical protein
LILAQISKGNYVPEELAKLAQASLKNKKAELIASLQGFYTEHFRWLLAESLQELVQLDSKLERGDKRIAAYAAACRSDSQIVYDSRRRVHGSGRDSRRDRL